MTFDVLEQFSKEDGIAAMCTLYSSQIKLATLYRMASSPNASLPANRFAFTFLVN